MAKEITQTFLMNRTAPITIGNELIDIYDHVNYLGYNIYFERQRYGLLLSRGITITNLKDSYNLQLVAAEQHMRWLRSAKEGDLVDIESTAYLIGSRKMRFKQIMKSGAKVLVESDLSGYFLNAKTGKVTSEINPELIARLSLPETSIPDSLKLVDGTETFPYRSAIEAFNARNIPEI